MKNKSIHVAFLWLLCFALLVLMTACRAERDLFQERVKRAEVGEGDIVLGIVDSGAEWNMFSEGVMLAVEQINDGGGLSGRKIRVISEDDGGDIEKGKRIAKKLTQNPDVVAVIGHLFSSVAISVSIIYEKQGVLFISPWATDPNLTLYAKEFTFRTVPNDDENSRQIAESIKRFGRKNVAVIYERSDAAKRLVDLFQARADEAGISTRATRSYFAGQTDFRGLLADLKKNYLETDAPGAAIDLLFVVGGLPGAGILIKQARDMGLNVTRTTSDGASEQLPIPIVGTDGLDSSEFLTIAGNAAENVIIPTAFNPTLFTKLTQNFVNQFTDKYGVEPDTGAALGYDAVQVFAEAARISGTSVPQALSSTLRFLGRWEGVTGGYRFTPGGDIIDKAVFFKIVRNGRFYFLPTEAEDARIEDPLYVIAEFTVRLPLPSAVETLDPGKAISPYALEVLEQLFVTLTDLDAETYEPQPELATQWEVSADGLTYRFALRENAVWTDGTPITAHDVVWAIQRNLRLGTSTSEIEHLSIIKNANAYAQGTLTDESQLGVRALDDFTLECTLTHPLSYFPSLASRPIFAPLPRHVIEIHGEGWTDPEHIQSSGPYQLSLWQASLALVLQKNPLFYEAESVSIPQIRYYIIPDRQVALAMYEQGELDVVGGAYTNIPVEHLPNIKTDPFIKQEFHTAPDLCVTAYGFHTQQSPVDTPLLRKAMAASIDRELLVKLVTRGDEEPATTLTHSRIFKEIAPQTPVGIPFHPEQAAQWLAEAGYPKGTGLPELSLLYEKDPGAEAVAVALRDAWRYYLNLQIELQSVSPAEFQQQVRQSGGTHLFSLSWCAAYPSVNNFLEQILRPESAFQLTGWNSKGFSRLVNALTRITDPELRRQFYRKAQQIVYEEDAIIIPLYFGTASMLVKPRVKGWSYRPIGGQRIRDWSLGD